MTDKLKQLEDIMSVLERDTVTQDEFVEMFGVLIDYVGQIKEGNEEERKEIKSEVQMELDKVTNKTFDKVLTRLKELNNSEWSKLKQKIEDKISSIKDGNDYVITDRDKREIASQIDVPVVEKIVEKTEIIREVENSINPEELAITVVNYIETLEDDDKISMDSMKGFKEFKNSLSDSFATLQNRTQLLNQITNELKETRLIGVYTDKITVSATSPVNPQLRDLWLDIS